jgi:glycosyltransferase involved in cell wall biosynthesis
VAGAGVEVEITTPSYSSQREIPHPLEVNWIPWTGSKEVVGGVSPLDPRDLLALARFLRDGRSVLINALKSRPADHCLALWALPSGWLAKHAHSRFGVPYSVWCLGSDIYHWARRPVVGAVVRGVLRGADHLFADGEDLRQRTERLSGKSCEFLPSLRVLPEADARGEARHNREFDFVYVGRYDRSKGAFLVLEALAAVRRKNPGITAGLLGWGPEEHRLKKRAERLGLASAVRFLGAGGPKEVARTLASGRCLLIPSYADSIPLVFGEALQAKIPLIVTEVGDLGTLTREHKLGIVVDRGDAAALASAMLKMESEGPPEGYLARMDLLLAEFSPETAARKLLRTLFGG